MVLVTMVLLVLSIVPVTGIRDENLLLNRGNDDVLLNMLLRMASIDTRVELLLVGELLLLCVFPCLFTPPFFDRQFLRNRPCSPPSLRYGCGTEVTPLFVLRD